MSTIVCQNIVYCIEPQVTETTTAIIKLKVAPPQPEINLEFINWGCCQTFSNNHTNCKEFLENEKFYTHPSAKISSFSTLNPKSLELCTENLGSETGATDMFTDCSTIFSSSSSSSASNQENSSAYKAGGDREKLTSKMKSRNEEVNSCRRFPPPLTTMSGSSSLQVRPHREGGRLIIEAVETPFRNSYLQAERSDGRLRLCYLTDSESDSDLDSALPPQSEVEEDEMEEPRKEFESEFDGEMNVEKFQWLSTCKERRHNNEGLCSSSNWKPPLWVATS